MLKLIIQKGTKVLISKAVQNEQLYLGNSPDADIILPTADTTARHAEIQISANTATLHPLASTPSIFVNAKKISSAQRIKIDDIINIGDLSIYLQAEDEDVDSAQETIAYQRVAADLREAEENVQPLAKKMNYKFAVIGFGFVILLVIASYFISITFSDKNSKERWQRANEAYKNNRLVEASREIQAAFALDSTNVDYRNLREKINMALRTQNLMREAVRLLESDKLENLELAKQMILEFEWEASQQPHIFKLFLHIEMKIDSLKREQTGAPISTEHPVIAEEKRFKPLKKVERSAPYKRAEKQSENEAQNRPPEIREIWLEKEKLIPGAHTNIGAYVTNPDGDSLSYHWSVLYGEVVALPNRFVYTAPEKLPPEGRDLITLIVKDKFAQSQQSFRTITIYVRPELTVRQKELAEKYYRLGYREEIDYQRPHSAAEYYKKVLGVAPDPEFLYYQKAERRLKSLLQKK
ncbi:FHA domain-containing protein [candidate division KSB1 bacterium]|nr:FHA domain-containing protein [candidate division KSB1 bacterium]